MKTMLFALLLSSSFLRAQDSAPGNSNPQNSKDSKGQVTLQGCVSRFGGDYILDEAESGCDIATRCNRQDKAAALPRAASRSDRDPVPDDEHKF